MDWQVWHARQREQERRRPAAEGATGCQPEGLLSDILVLCSGDAQSLIGQVRAVVALPDPDLLTTEQRSERLPDWFVQRGVPLRRRTSRRGCSCPASSAGP